MDEIRSDDAELKRLQRELLLLLTDGLLTGEVYNKDIGELSLAQSIADKLNISVQTEFAALQNTVVAALKDNLPAAPNLDTQAVANAIASQLKAQGSHLTEVPDRPDVAGTGSGEERQEENEEQPSENLRQKEAIQDDLAVGGGSPEGKRSVWADVFLYFQYVVLALLILILGIVLGLLLPPFQGQSSNEQAMTQQQFDEIDERARDICNAHREAIRLALPNEVKSPSNESTPIGFHLARVRYLCD